MVGRMCVAVLLLLLAAQASAQDCAKAWQETAANMSWQWGQGRDGAKCDSCFDALYLYFYGTTPGGDFWSRVGSMVSGVVSGNPVLVFKGVAGGDYKGDPEKAYRKISDGQRHNRAVLNLYANARGACGGNDAFVETFVGAADRSCDLPEARKHVEWQSQNNPESVAYAYLAYEKYKSAEVSGRVWSMFVLLRGQEHNDAARIHYRACYSSNREAFFGMVRDVLVATDGFARAEAARRAREEQRIERSDKRRD